jgi:Flp pilus assembly protein TadD
VGQYDKAIPHLTRAVELAPDNPRYRYALGLLYEQYGDVTKSKSWYNKAIIELEKTRMLNADYENVSAKIEAISKKGR